MAFIGGNTQLMLELRVAFDKQVGLVEKNLVGEDYVRSRLPDSACVIFFFQAEDGIRDVAVTGVQTCALPISPPRTARARAPSADLRSRPRSQSGRGGRCRRPEAGASGAGCRVSGTPETTPAACRRGSCYRRPAHHPPPPRGAPRPAGPGPPPTPSS